VGERRAAAGWTAAGWTGAGRTGAGRTGAGRTAAGTVGVLRRCLIALAALGVVATAVELAMLRHWKTTVQLIPWAALAVISAALVVLAVRPSRGAVRLVRALAVVVLLTAGFGVVEHVIANYNAGPLDFRYSARWATMSSKSRWWAAFTESVGPSPTLSPLVLAWSALCMVFATVDHPSFAADATVSVAETVPAGRGAG